MTDRFQNVLRQAGLKTAGLLLLAQSAAMATAAFAQALPAAEASPISTGFTLPRAAGSLQYACLLYTSLL